MYALSMQSVKESGRVLHYDGEDFIIVQCENQYELWRCNPFYSGYQLLHNNTGFEFIRAYNQDEIESIIAYETLYQLQKNWD